MGARRLLGGLLRARLSTKLVVFATLLTLVTVSLSFLALSMEIRRHTRRFLAETLARQQRTIGDLERQRLAQLLRTSTLLMDSPTLRAAMETYRTETVAGGEARLDLLATVATEAEKVARTLGGDLLVVTDARGRVLAATGGAQAGPAEGDDLSSLPVIRHVLVQEEPADDRNLSVISLAGSEFRVGAVPILLQGYIIGALVVGDVIDERFLAGLAHSFDGDVVLGVGDIVLATTLESSILHGAALGALAGAADGSARLVGLDGEEYVTAPIPFGQDAAGQPVTLYLLHSLSRAVDRPNHALWAAASIIGLIAVTLAGVAAALVSRSLLRPLSSFVKFLGQAAETAQHTRRFECAGAGHEVRILADNYNRLVDSLQDHERELVRRTQRDLEQLERFKESEKLAALGRMLSGAAHEINNPLTGVVGNVEVLLSDPRVQGVTRSRLDTVRKEGQRIVKLVKNLLKISHRETGERVTIDLNHVVREAAALRHHDFTAAGMQLLLDLDPEPLLVSGSELELQQVFLNIINNAFDELREVSAPALGVRSGRDGNRAMVSFTDNGPGVRCPERIFEHFFTTKPVGQGTGLGLSISQAIVQRHAGEIAVENPPGGGARFSVAVPLAVQGAAIAAEAPAVPVEAHASGRSLPASVLVVDDEPSVLELQMVILDSLGATAVGAASGAEAIACLEQRDFDLIVSDLRMPGEVSGKELYGWVEAHRPQCVQGFLFVTGDAIDEDGFLERVRARRVLKPFSMEEYVFTLRETLHALRAVA